MCSRVSLKNIKKHGLKITSSRFETCPKCGYNTIEGKKPATLPGGINPSLLLDISPSPQLLLSESNIIVYANKCAARILRVKGVEEEKEEEPTEMDADGSVGDPMQGEDEEYEGFEKPVATGLEGHTIDQLNINLVDEDMRRWVSIIQIFENIKLNLNKREAKKKGTDASQQAEMYGEGPKYTSYDYYGDQERASKGNGAHADNAIRDTAPVLIEREDGKGVPATMYVALVDPYSTGYSYSSVTFVPGIGKLEATFTAQMAVEDKQARRTRKRDKLKNKLRNHHEIQGTVTEGPLPEQAIGKSGESMVERIRRIKDLILDEMEYCFIALSPDGDIVITNAATKAVLGQETLEASVGEGFEWIARLDIWRPDFSERLPFEEWALNRLITYHQPLTQVIGMYAGPVPLVVELRGKCIWENPEKEEGLLAALAIVVDQTKWFTKEKKMLDVQARQEMFISTISRELKTLPVAGMVGLLELLYTTREHLNPEQLNYIRQIFGSVNSLLLVINDVIDFNKIVSGEVAVVRNAFILQDLVEELETLFTESMAKDGVNFEVDTTGIDKSAFGDGSRLMLLGDDGKIRRIAINMLSNAFKFTIKGKVTMRVLTQKVLRNSLEIRIEVKDTGVGISEEDQARIFAPLDELSAKDAKAIGADGIGLNIARKFASLLAGDIRCESVVGEGTKFWFAVPCGRPPPDTKPIFGPKEKSLTKTMGIVVHSKDLEDGPVEQEGGPKIHIAGTVALVVEDNWSHQVVMETRLHKIGCEVLTAVSGRDALGVLKKEGAVVDIIFMDIQMPLLDGFEVTKLLRRDPQYARWKHVPIIGVTATEGLGDREKAKFCGLDEFLVKPLTNEGTRELVEKFIDPVAAGMRRGTVASV